MGRHRVGGHGLVRGLFGPEAALRTQQLVDGLRAIAAPLDLSVALLALGWVLRQPGVACAIAGSSSPDGARRANAAAADLLLSNSTLQAIEDLIPLGPAFA